MRDLEGTRAPGTSSWVWWWLFMLTGLYFIHGMSATDYSHALNQRLDKLEQAQKVCPK
jgi:hypothetical protein